MESSVDVLGKFISKEKDLFVEEEPMAELLFKNLPYLLNDMEQKGWIIDSFSFKYKEETYFVILKLYRENQRKPSKYAKAKVEFIKRNNINDSINGYIDFYNVFFQIAEEFCDFFSV